MTGCVRTACLAHEAREAVCKDVAQTEPGRERKIMAVLELHGLTASLEAPTVKLPKKGITAMNPSTISIGAPAGQGHI